MREIGKLAFENRIKKIMQYNGYKENCITVEECEKAKLWTPVDLVCREYYNNGAGSAKGFLGITPTECIECFNYIRKNLEEIKSKHMLSEEGWNNFGFMLWTNWEID